MSKLIFTAAAAAVFSLVTFEGAYAGEKDVATTKGVATTPNTTPEKGFAVDQQSLSSAKNEPEGKVAGEKPSHGSAGK